jgi:hypothetical protein
VAAIDRRGARAAGAERSQARNAEPVMSPRRGRLLAGERVLRVPVWPAMSTIAAQRDGLTAAAIEAIDRSPVPVLVPGDTSWSTRASVLTAGPQGAGYALAAAHAGQTLSVQASRFATLLPHVGRHRGTHTIRGVAGFIGENEGIHTASWIEHGVAYSAELECQAPDGPECRRERLVALVEGLVYVGGVGAVGGAQ